MKETELVHCVLEAAGLRTDANPIRQRQGIGNHVYRVGRDYIVRLGFGADARGFPTAAGVLAEIRNTVKSPELLFLDMDTFQVPVMICGYLPGRTLSRYSASLSRTERLRQWRQVMEEVLALHQVGWSDPLHGKSKDWVASQSESFDSCLTLARNDPLVDQQLVTALSDYWQTHAGVLESSSVPVLVHNDVHEGNVVFSSGQLQGLIDFDDVIVAPAEVDYWYLAEDLLERSDDITLVRDVLLGVHEFNGEDQLIRWKLSESMELLYSLTHEVAWQSRSTSRREALTDYRETFLEDRLAHWFIT